MQNLQHQAVIYASDFGINYVEEMDVFKVLDIVFPAYTTPSDDEEILADEIAAQTVPQYEGAKRQITVNAYERNPAARKQCIAFYGYRCSVCGINFEEIYGSIGKDYIHVHHLTPLSGIGEKYLVDPIADLRPVCPNCHAMIHRRNPPYTIDELKSIRIANE